jgi:Peptidase family M28
MAGTRNHGLIVALTGIALLLAATLIAYRPPTPLGPGASPGAFSAYRAKSILQDLVGNGVPHPIGSAADAQVRGAIVKRLSALGYAPELQSGFVCNDEGVCGSPVNIIARLGASSDDRDAVLLAAHYDSVPAGPGASDDGAAVATVLEIARILKARPAPAHPIVLLLTDGEEAGLLGALLFVREHPLSNLVKAAVNLDARGTSGPSLMFETGTANTWLMRLYGSAIARPVTNSLYYVVYKLLQNDTDFTVFKAADYQGFNFAYVGDVGRYHTPLDSVANASADSIQHQGDNALAALSALADAPTLQPPIAEAVFFDGFARTLFVWPSEFTLAAAILSLALLLAETFVLLRMRAVSRREVLWGGVGTLCMIVFGTALCAGLLAVGVAVGKVPATDGASWISQPVPMHIAAAAIALLAAGGTSAWLVRRAGFWGFWSAAALLSAVLSVTCAVVFPGASFVLLLPAIAAGLAALPSMVSLLKGHAPAAWATDFSAVLPALVIFAAIFPVLQFMYVALGSLAWPVSTLVLSLGAATLLPLLAAASGRTRRRVTASSALIALAGVAVTLCLPTYSAEWPQRVNVEYWFDADTGESHYLARPDSLRLSATLAAVAHFDPVPRPRFAGSGSLAFYAAAPRLALAAPELSMTSRSTPTSQAPAASQPARITTHFDLHLRSARGAPEALVVFPAGAQVADIEVTTAMGPSRVKLSKLKSGATLLDIVGLPAAGVEFSIDAAGAMPVAVQIFDQSYDFPDGRLLQSARPPNAASSQDGDLTVSHRTVSLEPTAGR